MKKANTSPKVERQEAYRKHFGIEDKYLIEQESSGNGDDGIRMQRTKNDPVLRFY